jgi:hypothetical protein
MPKVFVSYSWDDDSHKAWVLNIATRLRHSGIDVTLDQWHVVPGDELPAFMEASVRESEYVLIVCTPKYKAKADRRVGGVGYEGSVITAELAAGTSRRKFVPLLRRDAWTQAAPSWLLGALYIDVRDSNEASGFEELLKTIWKRRVAPPAIGVNPFEPTPTTTVVAKQQGDEKRDIGLDADSLDEPNRAPKSSEGVLKRRPDSPTPVKLLPMPYELYVLTRIETKKILKTAKSFYGGFGQVRSKIYEDFNDSENEVVWLQFFKSKDSKLSAIEISPFDWAKDLIKPEVEHLWGQGDFVEINGPYGMHEFVYERTEANVLQFDAGMARRAFESLIDVNSRIWINLTHWNEFHQFRLLVYTLIKQNQTDFLLSIMSQSGLDKRGMLSLGISHAMLHCYMVGTNFGDYADNHYHESEQREYDKLFSDLSLSLDISNSERLVALRRMEKHGAHQFVGAAISRLARL